jgi:hypothetical protein
MAVVIRTLAEDSVVTEGMDVASPPVPLISLTTGSIINMGLVNRLLEVEGTYFVTFFLSTARDDYSPTLGCK